jgi:hypothetical protein
MPQHAAADPGVRLDADPRDPGPPKVQRQSLRADQITGHWVDEQQISI